MDSDRVRTGLLDDLAGDPCGLPVPVHPRGEPGGSGDRYRIRAVASAAAGWARPGDLPDGRERDEFDDVAVQVLGWDGTGTRCPRHLPQANEAPAARASTVSPAGLLQQPCACVACRPSDTFFVRFCPRDGRPALRTSASSTPLAAT